jgi:hypothetical protein
MNLRETANNPLRISDDTEVWEIMRPIISKSVWASLHQGMLIANFTFKRSAGYGALTIEFYTIHYTCLAQGVSIN